VAARKAKVEPDTSIIDDELEALQRVLDGSPLQAGDIRKAVRRLYNDVRYLTATVDGAP
jgi:hypothetical protein